MLYQGVSRSARPGINGNNDAFPKEVGCLSCLDADLGDLLLCGNEQVSSGLKHTDTLLVTYSVVLLVHVLHNSNSLSKVFMHSY